MPTATSSVSVFCPAGRWTQVEWYVGTIFLNKTYRAPGATVQWRWFSSGVPWYWSGSFRDVAVITLLPGLYTSLEFNPNIDTTVVITA